ncbi:TPA: hypothetical protein ACOJM5_002614 [Pseudomonas putida]
MVTNTYSTARQVVDSVAYQKIISELVEATGIEVEPEYPEVFARLDSAKIARANLDSEKLLVVLLDNLDAIKQYSIDKLAAFSDDEDDEEYPVGSEPVEDEKSKTISINKYSQGFLLTNILEYALAMNGREYLLDYIKLSKIPRAKKYCDQIVAMMKFG